jgi:DNA modification methylase
LADNKVTESEWNEELLALELEDLDMQDYDLNDTGFDDDEINEIINEEVGEDDFDVEEALEDIEVISETGDIWLLGRHRLLCGDSTKKEDYNRLLEGELIHLVVTDPPYNVNYGEKARMLDNYNKGHNNTDSIANDNMEDDNFKEFLYQSYKRMYEALKPGGGIYVFHADTEGINFRTQFKEAGFKLAQCLIWIKNQLVLGRQDYQWKHEPILYGWKPGAAHYWDGGRKQTTVIQDSPQVVVKEIKEDAIEIHFDTGFHTVVLKVPNYEVLSNGDDTDKTIWFFDKPLKNDQHPTMKPVGILARAIKNSSKTGQVVLDPFGGSGSTLIAAEQTGRISYLCELDPEYVDVIVKRYIEFKNNHSDVYLLKDNKKIPYSELV